MDTSGALAAQFRYHFDHRDHLYGVLLAELADDLEAGGPTADICADYLEAPRTDAVQLRLLAGIFRLVLRGAAPELEPFYPSLGGTADPSGAWPALRPLLVAYGSELRAGLALAPQTNEVGRSACLVLGIFEAVRRHAIDRVRLLELGASAGLNLNVDRYLLTGPEWSWGASESELVIETAAPGVRPTEFSIVDRRGCDVAPVDVSTDDGASYLRSFVWTFDLERHRRLDAAIAIARHQPPVVDCAPASTWLAAQLASTHEDGVLTVVWQSVTEQYWSRAERDAVAATIADARARMPLVHVSMEGVPPPVIRGGYHVGTHGPVTRVDGEVIARSHHHGPPVVPV